MDPAAAHAFFAQADPLLAFARDPILWGPLAGNQQLLDALRSQQRAVQTFVKGAGHG
jgi:D-arabinitol 4-dehydrogenase